MKTTKQILEIIRNARRTQHLSQELFAEELGLSQSSYAKIERGESSLDLNRFQRIIQLLNIPIENLMNTNSEEKRNNFKHLLELSKELLEYKEIRIQQLEEEIQLIKEGKKQESPS